MKSEQVGVMGGKGEQMGDGRWMMGSSGLGKMWGPAGKRKERKEIGLGIVMLGLEGLGFNKIWF